MTHDASRGVIVPFGGRDGSAVFADTWEWNGTNWPNGSP